MFSCSGSSPHQQSKALLRVVAALVVIFAGVFDGAAQTVPAAQQAALFSRILAYDRNLKARAGSQVSVGIIYNPANSASQAVGAEMLKAFTPLKSRTIQDLPFDVAAAPYTTAARLEEWLESRNIDVIYLCPGLDASFVEIEALAAKRKVVSLSSDRRQVLLGVPIGVVIKDDKPGIVVNLTSAKALGMELDPKLLQLAEVIR